MIDTKKLFTKILQKLRFNPTIIYDTKTEATQIGTTYEYTSIPDLEHYNVIGIRFTVYEATQVFWMVRGTNSEVGLIDVPTAGRFRGTITVNWTNNTVGIRCIAAPNSRFDLVHFKTIYGIA